MIKNKKAGMVLEGGGTRGVFTAGVLDCLMEENIYFPYVVGVSAGACNAVDYVSQQPGRSRQCMIPENGENKYFDLKQAIKTHSLFDMDMIFDRYPNELYPFDYETYFASQTECEIVATNCKTGKAEYFSEREDRVRLMDYCRASCSMPLASPMVKIAEEDYLDGGLADSIPVLRALKRGYSKPVLVLTRNKGYRKSPVCKSKKFYEAAYFKYPNLVDSIVSRAAVYNKTLEYIEKWEAEGKVFVIRPQRKAVSRTETNKDSLEAFYWHGYEIMKKQLKGMKGFLGEE